MPTVLPPESHPASSTNCLRMSRYRRQHRFAMIANCPHPRIAPIIDSRTSESSPNRSDSPPHSPASAIPGAAPRRGGFSGRASRTRCLAAAWISCQFQSSGNVRFASVAPDGRLPKPGPRSPTRCAPSFDGLEAQAPAYPSALGYLVRSPPRGLPPRVVSRRVCM